MTKKWLLKSIENRHSEFISESHDADFQLLCEPESSSS